MHELSVTESVLEIACRHAKKEEATNVTDIYLEIGRLSSIIDDSVQFYWDIISEGTICEGATLHFKRVPARLICQECHQEYTMDKELQPCPNCGSARIKVLSGNEFNLDSIEIERQP
ncbi:MAG: hydrogenase maturation nickel metallochaperone HypA [Brevefilum sp.]